MDKFVNECDGGCVSTPATNLSTVNGIGNPVLPSQAAMTGADQTSSSCIGSGDKWGGSSSSSKSKKKKYVVGIKNEKKVDVLTKADSMDEAKSKMKKFESRSDYSDIKIFVID